MASGSAGRGDDAELAAKPARVRREDERIRSLLQDVRERRSRGELKAAVRAYTRAANLYASRGEPLKGVALLRTAHELDPRDRDVLWRSAELLAAGGRVADAIVTYESLASDAASVGDVRSLLALYQRVVALQPERVEPRLRLAELCSQEGHTDAAIEGFRGVAARLLAAGRLRDYLRVAERLLFHDGDDVATLRETARAHLQGGETRHALVKIKALLRRAPGDAGGLELLGEALIALGKADKALLVALESARVQRTLGLDERRVAARLLRRAIDATPGEDASAVRALEELDEEIERLREGDPALRDDAIIDGLEEDDAALTDELAADDEVETLADELVVAEDERDADAREPDDDAPRTLFYTEAPPSVVAARREIRRVSRRRARAELRRSLEEARVFARNEMPEHALARLESVLKPAPDYAEALILQGELLERLERYAEAAVAYTHAEEVLAARDPQRALELAARLVALRFGRASDGSLRRP